MDIACGMLAKGKSILVVEDDPAVRRSLQLLLRANGYGVRAYESGDLLLSDASALGASCLIADYRMAARDGIDTLAGLKARGWAGPAILITGYHSTQIARSARSAGFDVVLEKPLRDHALMHAVDRLMHSSGGR